MNENAYLEEYIKEHFQYHEDGTLTRDDRKNGLGSLDKDGYLIIKVKGHQFKAHRIVWLLNYGHFPKAELDHKNRIKTDNRIENLRESNRVEQTENVTRFPNQMTGVVGVYLDRTPGLKKKYVFRFEDKTYRFYTVEDAVRAKAKLREERRRRINTDGRHKTEYLHETINNSDRT